MPEFCFVSFQIIRDVIEPSIGTWTMRVNEINHVMRQAIARATRVRIMAIWVPGGDGGQVAFEGMGCATQALGLIAELRTWANQGSVRLRISAHKGEAAVTCGADGRQQLVGDGITLCRSLIDFGTDAGVVVSDEFRLLAGV